MRKLPTYYAGERERSIPSPCWRNDVMDILKADYKNCYRVRLFGNVPKFIELLTLSFNTFEALITFLTTFKAIFEVIVVIDLKFLTQLVSHSTLD